MQAVPQTMVTRTSAEWNYIMMVRQRQRDLGWFGCALGAPLFSCHSASNGSRHTGLPARQKRAGYRLQWWREHHRQPRAPTLKDALGKSTGWRERMHTQRPRVIARFCPGVDARTATYRSGPSRDLLEAATCFGSQWCSASAFFIALSSLFSTTTEPHRRQTAFHTLSCSASANMLGSRVIISEDRKMSVAMSAPSDGLRGPQLPAGSTQPRQRSFQDPACFG